MVRSASLFSGRVFRLDTVWTAPSLSQPNSNGGEMRRKPVFVAMDDAMIDATAAAMPVDATQARPSLTFPASVGEKEAALLPVASCGRHGPVTRDAAATAFEEKVCILLEGNLENGVAALSGSVLVRVELAWSAAEAALKGAVVLLGLAWAMTEDDLKGAENVVRVLALVLFMHVAKALAAAALMLHGQNSETGFERAETSSSFCSWILALERFSSNILHMIGKVSSQRKKVKRLFPS